MCFLAHALNHVWVVQLERWALGTDARQGNEVVAWRRAGGSPLEGVAVAPWVVDGDDLAVAPGLEDVPNQRDNGSAEDEGEDRGDLPV